MGGIGSMNTIMSSNVMSGRAGASSGNGSVGEARKFVNVNQINPLIGGGAAAAAAAAGTSSTAGPISDVGNGAAGAAVPTPGALGGTTSVPGMRSPNMSLSVPGGGAPSVPRPGMVRQGRRAADFTPEDRKVMVKTHDLCVCGFGVFKFVLFVGKSVGCVARRSSTAPRVITTHHS